MIVRCKRIWYYSLVPNKDKSFQTQQGLIGKESQEHERLRLTEYLKKEKMSRTKKLLPQYRQSKKGDSV